jgi:membrane associated rhomboid family serine protease
MIPIGTDYRRRSTPWINYAIIAANVLLFIAGYSASSREHMARISGYMLEPDLPQLHQFFTCTFLHGGLWHLLGNMVFLWVFGNAVNDKLGNISYLAFYLAGGVLAGVGYLLLAGDRPVLGASGAIAAVAGMYLVLLPRTRVTVIFLLGWLIWPAEVSSLLFILIQFGFDLIMTVGVMTGPGSGGVAYAAHATGYLFGGLTAALLLATNVIPRDAYDLLNIIRHRRRRAAFQRVTAGGYDAFATPTQAARTGKGTGPIIRTLRVGNTETDSPAATQLRQRIGEAITRHDLDAAAEAYAQLLDENPEALLPRQQQLDIANQLMARQNYPLAAVAYEKFLKHYQDYPHLADIHLMLGLLYARYLDQPSQAVELLQKAREQLTDPKKQALANQALQQAQRAKGNR